AAVRGRVRERTDHVEHLDDRSGPAVGDDERHRVPVTRLHVNEVNLEPVDRRGELRQGVELRLDLAPVVLVLPVARERLQYLRLHALRRIVDEFRAGPACRGDAPAQVRELRGGTVDVKGTDVRWSLS